MFDEDDLIVDSGIDISSLEEKEDTVDIGNNSVDRNLETEEKMSNSKKAKLCIILGIILVSGIFIINSLFGSKGVDVPSVENNEISENYSEAEISDDAISKVKAVIAEQAKVIDNQKRQLEAQSEELSKLRSTTSNGEDSNNWKIFSGVDVEFDRENEASFTVIDIKSYVNVGNSSDVIKTKSIVKGNISGLVGDFEIEMPYTKASYLNKGTVLKIKYKYGLLDNRVVLGEIIF